MIKDERFPVEECGLCCVFCWSKDLCFWGFQIIFQPFLEEAAFRLLQGPSLRHLHSTRHIYKRFFSTTPSHALHVYWLCSLPPTDRFRGLAAALSAPRRRIITSTYFTAQVIDICRWDLDLRPVRMTYWKVSNSFRLSTYSPTFLTLFLVRVVQSLMHIPFAIQTY